MRKRTCLKLGGVKAPGANGMLELVLLSFVAGLLLLGLRNPFIWVLTYIYVDLIGPQKIGWAILPKIPFSLIAFGAAFAGWLVFDRKADVRFSFRQFLLLLLLAYCGLTTVMAEFPVDAAEKWAWVWKVLVFAIFLPLTLTSRLRIEAVALFLVLAIGTVVIDGGIKTALGGGGYGHLRFFVNEDSGIYESSTLATAAIAIIPLVLWLARFGTVFPPDWRVRLFAGALVFACLLIPVGTEARTGLLCIGVLAVLLLRSTRRRFLYMGLAGAVAMMAVPFLPQSFTERMDTIKDHKGDQSASTRIAVWQWTLEYVKDRPTGGGFNAYLGNSLDFQTTSTVSDGSTTVVETQTVTDQGRAYHSGYFEMLGEQGWPGLGLWLLFHLIGIVQMERIRRRFAKGTTADERWFGQLANALQQSHLIYMVGALFAGIAYQSFIYMIAALEIALVFAVRRWGAARIARPGQSVRPADLPLPAEGERA